MGKPVNTRISGQPQAAVSPVGKALELLEALTEPGGPHRLAALAHRTGLTKPTAHRHLRALAEQGYAQPSGDGAFRVGPRLLGLGAAALHTDGAARLVRPALADLRSRTGLLAYFAVRDGAESVCLELSEPAREYAVRIAPGDRVPLHAGGPGLAILAALPEAEADAVLDDGPLTARTPHTLTDPDTLRTALRECSERGYTVDDEGEEPDTRTLAAPVTDGAGGVLGALALRGLTFTLDERSVELYGPMLRAAARAVSAEVGDRTPSFGIVHGGGQA